MIWKNITETQSGILETNDLRELLGGYMHEQIAREQKHIIGKGVSEQTSRHTFPPGLGTAHLEVGASFILRTSGASRIAVVLLSQSSQTLLLGVCIDVCTDDKGNDVEEGHPSLLGQELLSKGESQRGGAPADLHDGKQTGTNGSADLVESAGAGDDGHG